MAKNGKKKKINIQKIMAWFMLLIMVGGIVAGVVVYFIN